jgi:hypothetical protein
MKMSNKTYDILKNIALYVLPALATLILTLGGIWGIPYAEAIAATITAIDTFLGAILGISSNKYQALQEMHEADEKLANSPLYPEDESEGE